MKFTGSATQFLLHLLNLKVVSLLLLIFVLGRLLPGCASPVKVHYQSSDSLHFTIKKQRFAPEASIDLQMGFDYCQGKKGRPQVKCVVRYKGKEENWVFPGLEVVAGNHSYFVSTFDRSPATKRGKDKYIHELSFFIPEQLFDTLVSGETPGLVLLNEKLYVRERSWLNIQDEINRKGLFSHAPVQSNDK
jgi:hypothetical protein